MKATANFVQRILYSIPGSHFLTLVWIGLYFVLFQLIHPVKEFWDTLLSNHIHLLSQHNWDTWRHMFRNGGEKYLATVALTFMLFNPLKFKGTPARGPLGVLGRFLLSVVAAIPIFIGLGILVHELQKWLHTGVLSPSIGSHPSIAAKLYADQWTTALVAFVAALVSTHFVMPPAYAYVMRFFAARRVARGKKARWYLPKGYRDLVHVMQAGAPTQVGRLEPSRSERSAILIASLIMLALFGVGFYVLTYLAK